MADNNDIRNMKSVALIERIAKHRPKVSTAAWATLWSADLNILERIARRHEGSGEQLGFRLSLICSPTSRKYDRLLQAPLLWLQKKKMPHHISSRKRRRIDDDGSAESSEGSAKSSYLERSKRCSDAKSAARERDGGLCFITRQDLVQEAHIYPLGLSGVTPKAEDDGAVPADMCLWSYHEKFWKEEKLRTWKEAIFNIDDTYEDSCKNILTLSPDAHGYHGKARFALRVKHASEDKKSMDLEFHWLRFNKYEASRSLKDMPQPSFTGESSGQGNSRLYNHDSDRPYCTGAVKRYLTCNGRSCDSAQ
ncbi:hypothetical protein KEM55_007951 [Ascosphaera atra]|nr:hypothetical protein KEM55_007951 [Ascosphaera atra]